MFRSSKLTKLCCSAIVLLATFLPARSSKGQEQSLTIPGAPACSACTIELHHVGTAGRPDDPIQFSGYSGLHRGPRNTIIAINTIQSGSVLLLDSVGRYLKQIAQPGSGGVFGGGSFLVGIGRGDSVYFRDRA